MLPSTSWKTSDPPRQEATEVPDRKELIIVNICRLYVKLFYKQTQQNSLSIHRKNNQNLNKIAGHSNQMLEMIIILNPLLSVTLNELWEKLFSPRHVVNLKKDKVNLQFQRKLQKKKKKNTKTFSWKSPEVEFKHSQRVRAHTCQIENQTNQKFKNFCMRGATRRGRKLTITYKRPLCAHTHTHTHTHTRQKNTDASTRIYAQL